ncbi:MAG: DUF6198 family protein [Clostridiales bacterium]|nr:DUF6198 family protein [Clostridiales bacterium]
MKRNLFKRIPVYLLGLLLMTFGIALSSKAGIGVAPISTIAFAGSRLTPLSFGMCSSTFHGLCFLAQLAITRKLTLMTALQIPAVYVFGLLIDLFVSVLRFPAPSLLYAIPLMVVSILIFSLGIRVIIGSDLVLPPPDSLVVLISEIAGWPVSKSKLIFDIAVVTLSASLTFFILGDVFMAIGIGTIICVLLTGPAIGFYQKAFPFFDIKD